MLENLKKILQEEFNFSANKNQLVDLSSLCYEIIRREDIDLNQIINYLKNNPRIDRYQGKNKFHGIKEALIYRRFPLTANQEKIDTKRVFLNKLATPLVNAWAVKTPFIPCNIFIEESVKDSQLAKQFKNNFPTVPCQVVPTYSQYLKEKGFSLEELKKPLVFIIKEGWDFLKPCPCTKEHLGCGYWILNLGFGCPFDCSYCFLQHYTNFPGLILPANLDDFFSQFNNFYQKIQTPIRIGTGEFCDSLALDHLTNYSLKLIPYFKNKNVFFELKTKSDNINNLLNLEASKNIVISWTLTPESFAQKEELATASIAQRLAAAKKIQDKGYSLGFHFDPIIDLDNWPLLYQELVTALYKQLKPPFAWISLGTLRSHRNLKIMNQRRFPESKIFYGELFISEDKKLRYPKFLRKQLFAHIVQLIRSYDQKTPLYFCMEDKDIWQILDKNLDTTVKIEKYLLNL